MRAKEKIRKKNEKSKKSFLLAFFFFTFSFFSLLVLSCDVPFNKNSPTVAPIPPGMGSFSLALSGTSRTVFPQTPALTHFDKLVLVFTAAGGGAVTKTETIDPYSGTSPLAPIFLQPGTYSLTINAYKNDALAARGEISSIEIELGKNTDGEIKLKALFTEGTGTFSWDITVPTTVNTATATITIKPLAGGTATTVPLSFTGTQAKDNRDLNSGAYNVTFKFDQAAAGVVMKSLEWSEIVHVYSTLESAFNKAFTEAHFNSTRYTLTLVSNNGDENGKQTVLHGGTVSSITAPIKTANAYLYLNPVPAPANIGFTFEDWYTDSALATPWVSSAPVIRDTTLYAKYTGAIDVSGSGGATEHNDVERAIAYVKENVAQGAYTLLVLGGATIETWPQIISTAGFDLTIQGHGGVGTLQLNSTGSNLFSITHASASLTLESNITLQGTTSTSSLVSVSGGTFTMKDGSKITGHKTSGTTGTVYVNNAKFNMEGGEISGNTAINGGGVYVLTNGTFTMNGDAKVTDNTATNGGGVYLGGTGNSRFTMSGNAKVTDNTATTNGGGVYLAGSASAFTMEGGEMSGNTATDNGGGVYVSSNGAFTMSGGSISDNILTGTSANGGGVYNGGTFTVGGTSKVSGNTKNNTYLTSSTYITLGTGTPVPPPVTGMEIHVSTANADGIIVNSGATAGDAQYFTADDPSKEVIHESGKLVLADAPDVPTFNNIAAFKEWLDAQEVNSTATPYTAKLNLGSLGGTTWTSGSVGAALYGNNNKYINLDLSGSTFSSIDSLEFELCTGLTSITIPESVASIGNNAFRECTGLTSINIPNSVTSIGGLAFYHCTSLTSISIPNSVTSIGDSVFNSCTSLTSITVDNNNQYYASEGGILYNKEKTTLIQAPPAGISNAFTIPDSVTSIGDSAFYYCTGLTSITIPNCVTSIVYQPFYFCTSLTNVTFAPGSSINSSNFAYSAFPEGVNGYGGNTLRDAYLAAGGGEGTYTRADGGNVWEKQ